MAFDSPPCSWEHGTIVCTKSQTPPCLRRETPRRQGEPSAADSTINRQLRKRFSNTQNKKDKRSLTVFLAHELVRAVVGTGAGAELRDPAGGGRMRYGITMRLDEHKATRRCVRPSPFLEDSVVRDPALVSQRFLCRGETLGFADRGATRRAFIGAFLAHCHRGACHGATNARAAQGKS